MIKTRFYLRKVGTPANRPTLIPLNPAAELGDCIRGRTVDEYPTIYITAESEHPKGFEIDQSIAADARGKLEVLEETDGGDIAVSVGKLGVVIGLDAEGSKVDAPAAGGAEMNVSGNLENDSSVKDGTTLKSNLQSPVDGSAVVDGETKEHERAQDELMESALLELVGANGISTEVVEGLLEMSGNNRGF